MKKKLLLFLFSFIFISIFLFTLISCMSKEDKIIKEKNDKSFDMLYNSVFEKNKEINSFYIESYDNDLEDMFYFCFLDNNLNDEDKTEINKYLKSIRNNNNENFINNLMNKPLINLIRVSKNKAKKSSIIIKIDTVFNESGYVFKKTVVNLYKEEDYAKLLKVDKNFNSYNLFINDVEENKKEESSINFKDYLELYKNTMISNLVKCINTLFIMNRAKTKYLDQNAAKGLRIKTSFLFDKKLKSNIIKTRFRTLDFVTLYYIYTFKEIDNGINLAFEIKHKNESEKLNYNIGVNYEK